jgi:hypothetical protein
LLLSQCHGPLSRVLRRLGSCSLMLPMAGSLRCVLPLVVVLGGGCLPTPNPSSGDVRDVCFFGLEGPLDIDCPMPITAETTRFDEDKCESALLAACTSSDADDLDNEAQCPLREMQPCGELQAVVKACFVDAGLTATCRAALQEQISLLRPNPDAG